MKTTTTSSLQKNMSMARVVYLYTMQPILKIKVRWWI